jgi:hypothetical protein
MNRLMSALAVIVSAAPTASAQPPEQVFLDTDAKNRY